ncbi:MAG: YihA family ribosome biogenesis GTP-binding protein [Chitinophagaceae bacterium]|nr:YihA family ribosome biogenesis GTP-binding protein [Chitinophagaceae bacterium]
MNIKSATYLISSPSVDKCPKAEKPEYAFIGRSNVGKSSLINMICNNQKLAKTSASPGKTQMINHFTVESIHEKTGKISSWYLVDLPGYGYAKVGQGKRKQWIKMIENYIRKRENLINLFVLIDSRHTPQAIDIEFINQLGEWNIPFTLVFTKADKGTQKEVAATVKTFLNTLAKTWQFLPQSFVSSAVKYRGRKEILAFIEECNEKVNEQTNSQ